MAKVPIFQCADTVGDGTGTTTATADYSAAPTVFMIKPPANDYFSIARLIVSIEDVGTMDSGSYGNNLSLTNGIIIRLVDDQGLLVNLTPEPVMTNAQWAKNCHDVTRHNWGSGNEVLTVRWTFSAIGVPIILAGNKGARIEVVLNDDLSGLVDHHFTFQGHYLDESY